MSVLVTVCPHHVRRCLAHSRCQYGFINLTNCLVWGGGEFVRLVCSDLKKRPFKSCRDITVLLLFLSFFL